VRVVTRLDQRALAVVIDEQIMGVAGEQQLGGARILQRDAVAPIAMQDGADEIGSLAPQNLGLLLRGVEGRAEAQILRRRHARRLLVGKPGQPDTHAADLEHRAIPVAGHGRAAGVPEIRAVEREFRLRHAREEHRLAEIEFVIARHEDVRRDHVGERDDVRALIESRHHRGRERVAAMRHDHGAAFRAGLRPFGLHDGCEARKSAARLAVRKRLLAHQVEIVEQHERHVRAMRRLRPPRAPTRQQSEGRGEGSEKRPAVQHVLGLTRTPLTCV
jgi:hypothetical protein